MPLTQRNDGHILTFRGKLCTLDSANGSCDKMKSYQPAKHEVPRTPSMRENLCITHANSRSRLNVVGNMLYCYVIHKNFFCLNTSLVRFQKGHSQSNSSYLQNFISLHCFNFWLSLDNDNFVFIFEVFTLYSTVL